MVVLALLFTPATKTDNLRPHEGYDYPLPKDMPKEFTFTNQKSRAYLPVGVSPLNFENPLITALLLSTSLGIPTVINGMGNHPDLVPVNPYITLLLSQYGRYLPIHTLGTKGIYYYAASNNYHNNKPFGSYKVYENMK